jgi:hypothetical protein
LATSRTKLEESHANSESFNDYSSCQALLNISSIAQAQAPIPPISPSPGWIRALPPGPDTRAKITEEYAKIVARDAYFWAWPMVNIYNRRQAFKDVKDFVMAGPVPSEERSKCCLKQD